MMWNWKSAVTSAGCRAVIFLSVNVPMGVGAGLRAMAVEFVFRVFASGLLGSLTEAFSRASLSRRQTAGAVALIATIGHAAEFLVHASAGTPRLTASLAASVCFTIVTTGFNLFAMRRGVLIAGPGRKSLADDLRHLPRLLLDFIRTIWASRRSI